jgi:hypothetical protein
MAQMRQAKQLVESVARLMLHHEPRRSQVHRSFMPKPGLVGFGRVWPSIPGRMEAVGRLEVLMSSPIRQVNKVS